MTTVSKSIDFFPLGRDLSQEVTLFFVVPEATQSYQISSHKHNIIYTPLLLPPQRTVPAAAAIVKAVTVSCRLRRLPL